MLHDQRGCGKSTPFSELRENTSLESRGGHREAARAPRNRPVGRFRRELGSTLSLAYAETHPDRCTALVLRGIFLLRRSELLWFYQEGASEIFPDAWEHYLAPIPSRERGDMMKAYYKRLISPDRRVRRKTARAWSISGGEHEQALVRPGAREEVRRREVRRRFRPHRGSLFVIRGFMKRDDSFCVTPGNRRSPASSSKEGLTSSVQSARPGTSIAPGPRRSSSSCRTPATP